MNRLIYHAKSCDIYSIKNTILYYNNLKNTSIKYTLQNYEIDIFNLLFIINNYANDIPLYKDRFWVDFLYSYFNLLHRYHNLNDIVYLYRINMMNRFTKYSCFSNDITKYINSFL